MNRMPEPDEAASQVAELQARCAALRQAARTPGAVPGDLLEALFAELDGAVELLRLATGPAGQAERGAREAETSERSLLRAAFADAPVPLFLLARDGTIQRANRSAGDLIGAGPGYATGRPFTAFVAMPSRAAVRSQLSAASRTGARRRVRCDLLGGDGVRSGELVIGRVALRGQPDLLMVAVREPAGPHPAAAAGHAAKAKAAKAKDAAGAQDAAGALDGAASSRGPRLDAVRGLTRRLDLVTAMARLLLENEGGNESRTLQRCARLLAGELAAWVIVDMERRRRLRRQLVAGPDDPGLSGHASAAAAADPTPDSVPCAVHAARRPALLARVEDAAALGVSAEGEPVAIMLDAASVLSVPLSDGENGYGVLTLARPAGNGHFTVADLALAEEIGRQMGLAIRVTRMFRHRSETADVLHASLLPRRMPEIPGLEIAATYIAAADEPGAGGDFYDVYRTPGGWGVAVGDVCGKDEDTAAVTAAARHAIRVLARRCADPAEVLSGANEIVLAEGDGADGGFVTASIAHLSWRGATLHAVLGSAGHPGPVLLRPDGAVRMMSGGGLPLGLFDDAEPARQELTLDEGDVLFLYTDGMAQARGQGNAYFHDRLAGELAGLAGAPPAQLVAAMRQAMLSFSAGDLVDDVTMLVLRAGRLPEVPPARPGTGTARPGTGTEARSAMRA